SYDPVEGQNPKYGASIHYWLKTEAKDSVTVDILDAAGARIATMKRQAKAGLNRAFWDLRYDRTKEAKLRVSPIFAPWFAVSSEGTAAPGVQRFASLVPPGTYTVRLSAAGQTLSQPVEVLKDPSSGGSLEDIHAQAALARTLSIGIDSTVDMINTVEGVRGQIASLKAALAGDDKTADLRAAADSLEKKYVALEEDLFQIRITGRGQDDVRWPYKLAEQLIYLGQQVASGDFAPNDQQREVTVVLQQKMRASRAVLDKLTNDDLSAFRKRLRDRNVTVLIM
ncbi:MAG: sialidase, partial [Gemmatimonadales bacterium]